jgi:hypothetical protein
MFVHRRSLVYRHHAFWCRWTVAQGAVGSDCVVVVPPSFDQDLGFAQRVEDFAIKQFVSEPGIEALTIAVLPRGSWGDERGFRTDSPNPNPPLRNHDKLFHGR